MRSRGSFGLFWFRGPESDMGIRRRYRAHRHGRWGKRSDAALWREPFFVHMLAVYKTSARGGMTRATFRKPAALLPCHCWKLEKTSAGGAVALL